MSTGVQAGTAARASISVATRAAVETGTATHASTGVETRTGAETGTATRTGTAARIRLARKVYLRWDRHAQATMLLGPERGLLLDPVAAEVVALCDGERSLADIVALLAHRYPAADPARIEADVAALVDALCRRLLLERAAAPEAPSHQAPATATPSLQASVLQSPAPGTPSPGRAASR